MQSYLSTAHTVMGLLSRYWKFVLLLLSAFIIMNDTISQNEPIINSTLKGRVLDEKT